MLNFLNPKNEDALELTQRFCRMCDMEDNIRDIIMMLFHTYKCSYLVDNTQLNWTCGVILNEYDEYMKSVRFHPFMSSKLGIVKTYIPNLWMLYKRYGSFKEHLVNETNQHKNIIPLDVSLSFVDVDFDLFVLLRAVMRDLCIVEPGIVKIVLNMITSY